MKPVIDVTGERRVVVEQLVRELQGLGIEIVNPGVQCYGGRLQPYDLYWQLTVNWPAREQRATVELLLNPAGAMGHLQRVYLEAITESPDRVYLDRKGYGSFKLPYGNGTFRWGYDPTQDHLTPTEKEALTTVRELNGKLQEHGPLRTDSAGSYIGQSYGSNVRIAHSNSSGTTYKIDLVVRNVENGVVVLRSAGGLVTKRFLRSNEYSRTDGSVVSFTDLPEGEYTIVIEEQGLVPL